MASVQENPGDINSIPGFLAQHRARCRQPRENLENLGPWLPSGSGPFPGPDEQPPSYPRHWPASSGKAASRHSVASSSTECTRFSSVFSGEVPVVAASAGGSNPHQYQHQHRHQPQPQHHRHQQQHGGWVASGGDVPDTLELSAQELRVMHEQVAAPHPPPAAAAAAASQQQAQVPGPRRMPCEFARYTGCTATFDAFWEAELWIRHELEAHLGRSRSPPAMCLCWFCDDFKFHAAETHGGDRMRNFVSRMMHIADHFQDGAAAGAVRPDFYFLDYLWENGLVGREVFEREKGVHEAVQVEGLRPRGYKTRRMAREEEIRGGVAVNTGREDRERRRARRQNGGPRDKV